MTIKLVSQDLLYFVLISFIFKSWDTDMEFVTSAFSYMYTLCPSFIPLFPFFIMRKVEQQMNSALRNRKNFSSGNTTVIQNDDNTADIFLHGNCIGYVDYSGKIAPTSGTLKISDAGWQTVTTKSRLNALCDEFAYGCYVFQKNFDWFLGDVDGNVRPFPTEEFVTV